MNATAPYLVPVETQRTEIIVVNSRFVTTAGKVTSVEQAREFLNTVRGEMPDASHHVYAFRVGYGGSVTEGMSDDGEPSGTAGPPVLAVLRGTEIGDVIVVVTRYFGGTKLGTGGLVRAYGDAARDALRRLKTELKIEKKTLGIDLPYSLYEQVKRLISACDGVIDDEVFTSEVTLVVTFPAAAIERFTADLTELSAGQVEPVMLSED